MTMQIITEYIDQVGFPPGVFNLVNGDKTLAEAFMDMSQGEGYIHGRLKLISVKLSRKGVLKKIKDFRLWEVLKII